MFKKNKCFILLGLVLVIALTFSTTAYAQSPKENTLTTLRQQALADAKEYLTTYSKVEVNEFGNEFTIEYQFKTSRDLDSAAAFIVEYGLSAFNKEVEIAIEEVVGKERQQKLITPKTTTPTVAYATISGDGTHTVSAVAYGLASFDTLGTVEYLAELSYRVNVSSGEITGLSSISFDIPVISAGGSWGDVSLPFHNTATNAGVTANYTITKSLEIPIGDFGIIIKSETDDEIFALLTTLQ